MTNPPMLTIKAVIFDHDGTLVDSEGVHCACWNSVLHTYQQQLSYTSYCADYNGLPTLETAQRIQQKFALPISASALYELKIAALNQHLASQPFPLLPGALEALIHLAQQKFPLAIASGANRKEVLHSVAAHKLAPYFAAISTKNDVTNSKPSPDVYLHAAAQIGIEPQYCLAIEDSDTGEQSAIAAGMPCIRLTPTPNNKAQSYPQFKTLKDALPWLQQLKPAN